MGLLKTALIGTAIYGAVNYLTKKDKLTGRSIIDDLTEKTPKLIDDIKELKEEVVTSWNNPKGTYSE